MPEDKKTKRIHFHGFYLKYNPEDYESGVKYLRDDLSRDAVKVFFDQARRVGIAEFENEREKKFEIIYKNGVYTLRQAED